MARLSAVLPDVDRRGAEPCWRPHPDDLLQQLQSSGLVEHAALTPPWLWDVGDAIQLVFGLTFSRPVSPENQPPG